MKSIEVLNFNQALIGLTADKFSGKLSYAIYKNLKKCEPIVKQYYEDIQALAKAYNIEDVEGRYTFEGDSKMEFEAILNAEHELELHKVSEELLQSEKISVNEIAGMELMINN